MKTVVCDRCKTTIGPLVQLPQPGKQPDHHRVTIAPGTSAEVFGQHFDLCNNCTGLLHEWVQGYRK